MIKIGQLYSWQGKEVIVSYLLSKYTSEVQDHINKDYYNVSNEELLKCRRLCNGAY